MITTKFRKLMLPLMVATVAAGWGASQAAVQVQCPGDVDGDAQWTGTEVRPANTVCRHLVAGDGFATMADGRNLYTFGFSDVTGTKPDQVMLDTLTAALPAPTIELNEGNDFYLTLTNVAFAMRPDLFDPHTVHFHGFPQQPPVFDGMPEGSFGANMGSSVTYFYRLNDPGTYLYHCHQEATEHMQMGMIGNLYVKPRQDGTDFTHQNRTYSKFVYNDGDGSTGYDVAVPLQLSAMDHVFHEAHLAVQPLPFKDMRDTYVMINGRGYPDTVNPAALPTPSEIPGDATTSLNNGTQSQKMSALVTAVKGQRILLRMSNVSVTSYYTVTAQGLPMRVVGSGARQLRGTDGKDLYYETTSVTLGGGETADVLIDTTNIDPGTYFLYTTNLNYLSNFDQDSGGVMTEIVIAAQ